MKPFIVKRTGTVVEVWSGYRIQFGGMEAHLWQRDLKTQLKDALSSLFDETAGDVLAGRYNSTEPRALDTENSLFTNVLESMPSGVRAVRFERGLATTPSPPEDLELIGRHVHYYRYEVGGRWTVWEPDAVVARWQRIPRRLADDGSARPVWFALREGHVRNQISLTGVELPAHANFGLRLTVHASTLGPRNAIAYSERLFDGTIAAFHNDHCTDTRLAALSAKLPVVPEELLRQVLDQPVGPLFATPAIHVKGSFVQISPADERCILGELVIVQDSADRCPQLSGELFTVRPRVGTKH